PSAASGSVLVGRLRSAELRPWQAAKHVGRRCSGRATSTSALGASGWREKLASANGGECPARPPGGGAFQCGHAPKSLLVHVPVARVGIGSDPLPSPGVHRNVTCVSLEPSGG